jgi:hypothetical protein
MGKMQGGMNMMFVRGSISANNTSSITVTTDGNTIVVNISASTSIKVFAGTSTPPTAGTVTDLVVGKNVMAGGQRNSDGSIQASMISVGDNLPMMKMGDSNGPMIPAGMPGMMGSTTMWMNGDGQGGEMHGPMGFMPTTNGPQHGPGTNGGPQNW